MSTLPNNPVDEEDDENVPPILERMVFDVDPKDVVGDDDDNESITHEGVQEYEDDSDLEHPPVLERMDKHELHEHDNPGPITLKVAPLRLRLSKFEEEDQDEVDEESKNETATSFKRKDKDSKRRKNKGRNGNIYIGVANRVEWLRLQRQFGFPNINSFGNFVLAYMDKVYDDFDILHKVAVDLGLFTAQGLAGFKWVNGLPHPVDEAGNFISLPSTEVRPELAQQAFSMAYDLAMKRASFLVQINESPNMNESSSIYIPDEGENENYTDTSLSTPSNPNPDAEEGGNDTIMDMTVSTLNENTNGDDIATENGHQMDCETYRSL